MVRKLPWWLMLVVPVTVAAQTPALTAPVQNGPALHAAPRDPVRAGQATAPRNPQVAAEARAKVRNKIRAIRSHKLAEVIQPDAATMLKLGEIAEKFEEQLEQKRAEAQVTRTELQKATQAAKPDEAAVQRLTAQFIAQRGKLAELETAREDAVRAVLKPVDFAKLVLAWPKINREIREEIYKTLPKKHDRPPEF